VRIDAAGGAELADLLKEIDVRVEEKRQARGERIDVHAGLSAASTYANPSAKVNASS